MQKEIHMSWRRKHCRCPGKKRYICHGDANIANVEAERDAYVMETQTLPMSRQKEIHMSWRRKHCQCPGRKRYICHGDVNIANVQAERDTYAMET